MLILMCNYKEEMCVVTVTADSTLKSIHDRISNRWTDLKDMSISLYYVLPDDPKWLLCSNDDVQSMIAVAESYSVKRVKVEVVCNDVVGSSSSYNGGSCVGSEYVVGDEGSMISSSTDSNVLTFGWDKIVIKEGQLFVGGADDFRECLQKLSIQTGFKYVYKKNDSCRIYAVCAKMNEGNCGWYVRASEQKSSGFFYVTKLCNVHTCGTSSRSFGRDRRMTSDLLSKVVLRKVREDSSFSASDLHLLAGTDHGRAVSYDVAWSAVKKARDLLYGDVKTSFKSLHGYVNSVRETNPGSVAILEVHAESCHFKRMFIAFDACIRGFKHCRPMLFLDGAHLKFDQSGHLLGATGKDGDNGMSYFE